MNEEAQPYELTDWVSFGNQLHPPGATLKLTATEADGMPVKLKPPPKAKTQPKEAS